MVATIIASYLFSEEVKTRPDFCKSCHLKTNRLHGKKFADFLKNPPVNLAGRHKKEDMNCTGCHRGLDFRGKASIFYEEIKNSFIYFLGTFAEPDKLSIVIPDANCVVCHKQYKPSSRFHNLDAHESMPSINCIKCHEAHNDEVKTENYFLARGRVYELCSRCHPGLSEKIKDAF